MRRGLVVVLLVLVLASGSVAADPTGSEASISIKASTSLSVSEKAPVSDGEAWEGPCEGGLMGFYPDDEVRVTYLTTCAQAGTGAESNPLLPIEEGCGCDHPWCCTIPWKPYEESPSGPGMGSWVRGHYCAPETSFPRNGSVCRPTGAYNVPGCSGEIIPGYSRFWWGAVCGDQGPCSEGQVYCYFDSWPYECGGCWCE